MKKIVSASILIPLLKENKERYCWMQKRVEEGPLQGLWEFPGGKLEVGESAEEALIREVKEEASVTIQKENLTFFSEYLVELEKKQINLNVYLTHVSNELEIELRLKGQFFKLCDQQDINKIKELIPPGNVKILEDLVKFHNS
jgi:8-oxo-dGTP diphosphatase